MRSFLADLILIVHFAFVSFVVGGLGVIWAGAIAGWNRVRDLRFRVAHLAAVLFVMAESLAGILCPLTVWEDALRGRTEDQSFVARLIHRVLFYDLPEWLFTVAYCVFAAAVIATWWAIPPRSPRKERAP
jgi:hypothetical protein